MPDYLLLMHDDTVETTTGWDGYVAKLRASGGFEGGSSIGNGECLRKTGAPKPLSSTVTGYIKVTAPDLAAARALVDGNPVYEAGGTVELRELPRD